ncbi:MAG: hypothetical protein AMXMBFR64_37730 [Myxococcales bacterium]
MNVSTNLIRVWLLCMGILGCSDPPAPTSDEAAGDQDSGRGGPQGVGTSDATDPGDCGHPGDAPSTGEEAAPALPGQDVGGARPGVGGADPDAAPLHDAAACPDTSVERVRSSGRKCLCNPNGDVCGPWFADGKEVRDPSLKCPDGEMCTGTNPNAQGTCFAVCRPDQPLPVDVVGTHPCVPEQWCKPFQKGEEGFVSFAGCGPRPGGHN